MIRMATTAQQQRRVYLVAKPGKLFVDDKRSPGRYWLEWHPEIINTGQTPAYNVRVTAISDVGNDPLPPGSDLQKELEPTGAGSTGTLGRGQPIWPACHLNRYLSASELDDLRRQRGEAWYVWGL
jgi:hypothetical protein